MLVMVENNELIRGLRLENEVSITHLLFTDDSLIFSQA